MTVAAPPADAPVRTLGRGRLARLATEQVVGTAALAVVGLHVVDDAFLQPEPGTSPADHLASGLVPLALLGVALTAFRRGRAGVRATAALLAGFFGILAGTEAAYYAANGGPSGDDFTGMLSALAGFALLGLGGATLWRSRRSGDSRRRRLLRRSLAVIGAVLVAGVVLFPTAIAYVVTHTARAEVPAPRLGAAHEDVAFTTSDGLRLEGWFVPSRNGATVIAFPGRAGPQKHTRMLVRHGYGVLLFDRRGEGASEGDPNAFGWKGERDLHAAVTYLRRRPDVDPDRIGGIGLSVGGEMLIHAAAQSDAFRAIVSEGASGQSVRDDTANAGLLEGILAAGVVTAATALFSSDLPPPSLKSDVARIAPRAVFLVYGERGQGGTEEKPNRGFHAAAGAPKELWEVPGGQHIAGITTRPEEYERRVVGFLDRELRGEGAGS
ncbi:MAG TPA: CocE/NonD family hydrolase [Gaiellaceae bacterium]|nr:CocE/NonD family hydrolase [Gaiellaceae bacterium]